MIFIYGFLLGLVTLGTLIYHNWKRSQSPPVYELQHNRLLTRHPLVFVSGKRSLFYFMSYWNLLPSYLAAHGYEVFLLPLPWSHGPSRQQRLHSFLKTQSEKNQQLHLIMDSSSRAEMNVLLTRNSFSCLASVTLIQADQESEQTTTRLSTPIEELQIPRSVMDRPFFWKLHLTWTAQNPKRSMAPLAFPLSDDLKGTFLDRFQFLAERDLLRGPPSSTL